MFFQIYSDENWITIKCENKIRCQKTRKTFIKKIEKGSRIAHPELRFSKLYARKKNYVKIYI